jgi:hypothetical protein
MDMLEVFSHPSSFSLFYLSRNASCTLRKGKKKSVTKASSLIELLVYIVDFFQCTSF